MLSPAGMVVFQENPSYRDLKLDLWYVVTLNFAWYGAILLLLRYLCLSRADRYLGRV
jgi:hypothetical protein